MWVESQKDEGESATFIGQVEHSEVSPAVETEINPGTAFPQGPLVCFHLRIHLQLDIFRLNGFVHISPHISALNCE